MTLRVAQLLTHDACVTDTADLSALNQGTISWIRSRFSAVLEVEGRQKVGVRDQGAAARLLVGEHEASLGRPDAALARLALELPHDVAASVRESFAAGTRASITHGIEIAFDHAGLPCTDVDWVGGTVHAAQGDADGAIACIEEAVRARTLTPLAALGTSPLWDPIRHDPRFQALLEEMNLADVRRR